MRLTGARRPGNPDTGRVGFMDTETLLDISSLTVFSFTEPGDKITVTGDADADTLASGANAILTFTGVSGQTAMVNFNAANVDASDFFF